MTEGSQSRILVVDDVRESALITRALLARGNFDRIDIASGGLEALKMCGITPDGEADSTAEHPYQLVVLDIMMPDIDGLEVCARMRLAKGTRDLPILMLTATNDTETLNQAFMAGADDFLTKPIDEMRLLARIRNLLRMRREQERRALREEDLRVQNAALRQGQLTLSLIDPTTNLLKDRVLELVLSDCRARGRPAALSLVRIIDYGAYVAAHGQDKGEALLAQVADMLQAIPAPLAVYLTAYGPGSFMLIHPGAPSASELEDWNARAAEAVELAAINHGNSIQAEHVTLWTRTVWAEPSGLAAAADTIIDRTKQELLERQ